MNNKPANMPPERLLDLKDVNVHFELREGIVKAVNGVSYHVNRGEVLGIVGESGSGKSVAVRAIMRLFPKNLHESTGQIRFQPTPGEEVDISSLTGNSRQIRQLRGNRIGMIFQEPMTALSPVHSVGTQITRTILLHRQCSKKEARERAIELLGKVQLPRPELLVDNYPHQLSGGMRQRAMIALALSCDPDLLIADEPTTALDVTTEAQILDLLRGLQDELGMSIIFITHNFGVVADIADRVSVMYLGRVLESGPVDDIFYNPQHPYTRALLQSVPRLGQAPVKRLKTIPGMVPDPFSVPKGCPFHPRCEFAVKGLCDVKDPEMVSFSNEHEARCLRAGKLEEAAQ
ncbi:ABC transporter ATP-binding protein [uncultured Cohaesibacter sp.]|uniref:ABC transporter ATP-binding protein n=1 Tax=uncultured Cohaesibacter sp. TaxID=1002546 RepID=UPI002930F91D|nr:ABC transporter ATP-binding protein [uncultured Cohaesibacter sp.]